MEPSNQQSANPTTNKILWIALSVFIIVIIVAKAVSHNKQETYNHIKETKLLAETRYADSITNYQDSLTNFASSFRDSVQVIKCYVSSPNSAGGVDLNVIWKNNTLRTVKYARFGVDAYNSVNDIVGCEIRGSGLGFRVTGPIRPGKVDGYGTYWECAWYNHTIQYAKVHSVTLIFMDDSEVTFEI